MSAWRTIGASETVIRWITEGVLIPLTKEPTAFELANHRLSLVQKQFVLSEIDRLLDKGYIRECTEKTQYISPIGCVPKKSKGFRLITDFRHINSFCQSCHFKQEDIISVANVVKAKDHLNSLDLRDGFYHIPVRAEDQELLSFQFEGRYFFIQFYHLGTVCHHTSLPKH